MFVCLRRHAQDVRELYERKLERANNLYMELCACMLQMEKRERELAKSAAFLLTHSLICSLRSFFHLFIRLFIDSLSPPSEFQGHTSKVKVFCVSCVHDTA